MLTVIASFPLVVGLVMAQTPPEPTPLRPELGDAMAAIEAALGRADLAEAERLSREFLTRFDDPADIPARLWAIDTLCYVLGGLGRYDEALDFAQQAVELTREFHGHDPLAMATAMIRLAGIQQSLGAFDWAERAYHDAIATLEASFGEDHPKLIAPVQGLGALMIATERFDEGEACFRRCVDILLREPVANRQVLAKLIFNIGWLRSRAGDLDRAEPLLRQAVDFVDVEGLPVDPALPDYLDSLAEVIEARERFDEARPLRERSLTLFETIFGPEHPRTVVACYFLAQCLRLDGDPARSHTFYQEALARFEANDFDNLPLLTEIVSGLAQTSEALGRVDEAERHFERVVELRAAFHGPDHPQVAHALLALSEFYRRQDRPDEAQSCEARANTIFDRDSEPQIDF